MTGGLKGFVLNCMRLVFKCAETTYSRLGEGVKNAPRRMGGSCMIDIKIGFHSIVGTLALGKGGVDQSTVRAWESTWKVEECFLD